MNLTRNFTKKELQCKCGCESAPMDKAFLVYLQELRDTLNTPMFISSGYRCPDHDAKVGGARVHTSGKAVDILCSSEFAFKLLQNSILLPFTGIGISQKGPMCNRFIHLDCMESKIHPRPRIWTY